MLKLQSSFLNFLIIGIAILLIGCTRNEQEIPTYRFDGLVGATQYYEFDEDAYNNISGIEGSPITQIVIQHGDIIDNLQVHTNDSVVQVVPSYHGNGLSETITFSDDVLTSISGSWGEWFGSIYILQLTFHTRNGQTYGPYGTMQFATSENQFRFDAETDEQIVAITGAGAYANNGEAIFLGSLGVVIRKN